MHLSEVIGDPPLTSILGHYHVENSSTKTLLKTVHRKRRVLKQKHKDILKVHLFSCLELDGDQIVVRVYQLLVLLHRQL